jgi:cyclopropane fatty-acyl-phospholipid synthase-like methyltransferase
MNGTPRSSDFDAAYESYSAPWVIGEPQPAVVELEREGQLRGAVLDIGCGAGEHTIYLAQLGYDVRGIDASVPAIDYARTNANRRGVEAKFAQADALRLGSEQYHTILDSALFHIFGPEDRVSYVASLSAGCRQGGFVHILALSDEGPGFGPEVSEAAIREAFREGWEVQEVSRNRYIAVATAEHHVTELGLRRGERVELPARLARIRRV